MNSLPHVVLTKLTLLESVSKKDRELLGALPFRGSTVSRNEILVEEGDKPPHSIVVLEGILFRYKAAPQRRQIISLHPAGDMPDLQSLFLDVMDHGLCTGTAPAVIATVAHSHICALLNEGPSLARALWRETLVDAAQTREALVNMGARNALERTAHFFVEHFLRMRSRGLAHQSQCPLPMTQTQLSEALGLSLVSMNRCVKALRSRGMAEHAGGILHILDEGALKEISDFDDTFMHLRITTDRAP